MHQRFDWPEKFWRNLSEFGRRNSPIAFYGYVPGHAWFLLHEFVLRASGPRNLQCRVYSVWLVVARPHGVLQTRLACLVLLCNNVEFRKQPTIAWRDMEAPALRSKTPGAIFCCAMRPVCGPGSSKLTGWAAKANSAVNAVFLISHSRLSELQNKDRGS